MINSVADFLKEARSLDECASKENIRETQQLSTEFAVRFCCIQGYFLRSSWANKIKFLAALIEEITDTSTLNILLDTLFGAFLKSNSYSKSLVSSNYVYTLIFIDDNRALHKKTLEQCFEDDVKLFKRIDQSMQMTLIIGLMRLGGDAIIQQSYMILRLARKRKNKNLRRQLSAPKESSNEIVALPKIQFSEKSIGSKIFLKIEDDTVSDEVKRKRKEWADLMSKYRKEIDSKYNMKLPKEKSKKQKKKKNKKSGKGSKSSKSSKRKGSKKKKGKSPHTKDEEEAVNELAHLDWIQLLPVWTAKQIFSYLDKKSLKKAREVNAVWKTLIDEVIAEKKARKTLNKAIKKLEGGLEKHSEKYVIPERKIQPLFRITQTEKRLVRMYFTGCTTKALRRPFRKNQTLQTSLVEEATRLNELDYLLPVDHLVMFRRNVSDLEMPDVYSVTFLEPGLIVRQGSIKSFEYKVGMDTSSAKDQILDIGSLGDAISND